MGLDIQLCEVVPPLHKKSFFQKDDWYENYLFGDIPYIQSEPEEGDENTIFDFFKDFVVEAKAGVLDYETMLSDGGYETQNWQVRGINGDYFEFVNTNNGEKNCYLR